MNDQPLQHPYPSEYRPGTHWATDEAWTILDRLPVGMLPDEDRFLVCGMIAGALMRRGDVNGDLLAAAEAQHQAIDILLATVAAQDRTFMPTKSVVWPMMVQGHKAIEAAKRATRKSGT